VRRAESVADFAADPAGRFVLGSTYVLWCHSTRLIGTTHWGHPGECDPDEIARRLSFTSHPALAAGFDVLTDTRAIESLEGANLSVIVDQVRHRLEPWSQRIQRHAIVISPGVVAPLITGLLSLLGPSYPVRFFHSLDDAQAWLGRGELPAVLDEVEAILQDVRVLSPVLRALRSYLERSLDDATIDSAARSMQVSARTLQRELRRLGVRFKTELAVARLRVACFYLSHSDEKVELVARRVGLAASQFHTMFRQLVGMTPAEYRVCHRTGMSRIRSLLSSD
jgi:AraC-like DNA-binding protein